MDFIKIANEVLKNEIEELKKVEKSFNKEFEKISKIVINCKGRVLLSGIGKSGIIGKKVSAVFASVGVPSFFIHPVEAIHGELGNFESDDVLIVLSCSGNTKEVQDIVLFCKRHKIKTIAITCSHNNFLSKNCDIHIGLEMSKEAIDGFPIPTTSCLMTLAVCDAITACIVKYNNLSKEKYGELHSGGSIGKSIRRLLRNKKNTKSE